MASSNYVSIDMDGGLGNQLIQIAITLEYAKNHNKYPIFLKKDKFYDYNNHSLSILHDYRYLLTIIDDIDLFNTIKFDNFIEIDNLEYKPLPFKNGNVLLSNLNISHLHISDTTKTFINKFIYSNNKNNLISLDYYNKIKCKFNNFNDNDYCFLHIRCGDFLKFSHYPNLDYIEKAINLIGLDKIFIVFSDDIIYSKLLLSKLSISINIHFIDDINNKYIELILMTYFKNGIVNPYSSYSWLGAFLGEKKNKIIVSKYSYNLDNKIDINPYNDKYPNEWIEI